MMAWIWYPNRQASTKISSYIESYEYVKVYDGDAHEFIDYLIICGHITVT